MYKNAIRYRQKVEASNPLYPSMELLLDDTNAFIIYSQRGVRLFDPSEGLISKYCQSLEQYKVAMKAYEDFLYVHRP